MFKEFKTGKVTLGELIRLACGIYKNNFKYILIIGLGIYIPTELVVLLLNSGLDLNAVHSSGDISGLLRFMLVMMMLAITVLPLETAAITYLVRQRLENETPTAEGVLEASFGNWKKLTATTLLFVILICFCSFLIIPAIIFCVSLYFHSHIVVVSKTSGVAALIESARMVKGRWWKTFSRLTIIALSELVCLSVIGHALDGIVFIENAGLVGDITSLIMLLITDILCMVFKIFIALYFFNLYYTVKRPEPEAVS